MVSSHFKIREKKRHFADHCYSFKKNCLHTCDGTEFTNHMGQSIETGFFHSILSLKAEKKYNEVRSIRIQKSIQILFL